MSTITLPASLVINGVSTQTYVRVNVGALPTQGIKSVHPLIFEYEDDITAPIQGLDNAYIIKCGTSYNFGKSTDPLKTVRELQVSNPEELKLVACWPASLELKRELYITKRLRGDWYTLDDENVATIFREVGQMRLASFSAVQEEKKHHVAEPVTSLPVPSRVPEPVKMRVIEPDNPVMPIVVSIIGSIANTVMKKYS